MDVQQIGVKLTFDALRLPLQVNTFDDRLIAQKAICLAQAAGLQLGYHFHWYLRGPYSPSLTKDLYAASQAVAQGDDSATWDLDQLSADNLARIRPLFEQQDRTRLAFRLELLASTWYLIKQHRISASDLPEIQRVLKLFGKTFSEHHVREGVEDLKRYGLIPA